MIELKCKCCGALNIENRNGMLYCPYCDSSFLPDENEQKALKGSKPQQESKIGVKSDVEILLEKCRKEPGKARVYANLVLDIDPTNKEAKKYL
ncbi:MAG: hypothetical protein E7241_00665 [Lachnospiraceae bacterium]|nr:hypothetical protein [Lachnospiraceae bacterium]